jgi:predicted dehydrogenase
MAPIRLGVIGLTTTPGAWFNNAHLPYLSSPLSKSKYTITALSNSSVASAKAAIKANGLPSTTAAYDSPEALAADPNVDMVIVSVNVTKHYELIKPALLAGKMAYVEWPLGQTTKQAVELLELAKEKGVKTAVGLQAAQHLGVREIKRLIAGGEFGRVISSGVVSEANGFALETLPEKYKYFGQREVGGSWLEIWFGHCEFTSSKSFEQFC